jgi:metallophosphoesterase superfamily enzyme
MAGHLHPAVRLAGRGGQSLALPCFYFGHAYAVLPAFGDFTGTALVSPRPGERVVVVADDTLIEKTV